MYMVEYAQQAIKDFKKLDKYTRMLLLAWVEKNLVGCFDPRQHGKALTSNRGGQWKYRVGDYRLLAEIENERIIILILTIGHRKKIY